MMTETERIALANAEMDELHREMRETLRGVSFARQLKLPRPEPLLRPKLPEVEPIDGLTFGETDVDADLRAEIYGELMLRERCAQIEPVLKNTDV